MAGPDTVAPEKLVTLIIDRGARRSDLAFPAGITLADALKPLAIGSLIPFSVTGESLRAGAVLGREIPSGTLILLRERGWADRSEIRVIDHSAQVRANNISTLITVLSMTVGLFAGAWTLLVENLGSTPPEPWLYSSLAGSLAVFGILLACRTSTGRPLLEVGGPAALVFGAASLASLANPGDYTHQVLITAMLGISIVSLLRWLYCGNRNPDVGNVCIDTALIALIVALLDVGVMALGQPIQLTAAIIFGLCPPLLAAISGFSIRVSSDVLLDQESVIREAAAVRVPPADPSAQAPPIPLLLAVSSARNRLWTVIACLGITVTSPVLLGLVGLPGWRGMVAMLAILAAFAACMLIPRKSSSMFVRVLPRITAGLLVVISAVMGSFRYDPFSTALFFAALGLLFVGATLLMRDDRRYYGFSRLGDIVQSFSVTLSLPLSMAAIGIISLVRTGGLG